MDNEEKIIGDPYDMEEEEEEKGEKKIVRKVLEGIK